MKPLQGSAAEENNVVAICLIAQILTLRGLRILPELAKAHTSIGLFSLSADTCLGVMALCPCDFPWPKGPVSDLFSESRASPAATSPMAKTNNNGQGNVLL